MVSPLEMADQLEEAAYWVRSDRLKNTLMTSAAQVRRLHSEREELINALQRMVRHERGQDQHSDRVGALYTADMALNLALGGEAWPL